MTRKQYYQRWLADATPAENAVKARVMELRTHIEQFAPPQEVKDTTTAPRWAFDQIESGFRNLFDAIIIRVESAPADTFIGSQLACRTVETAPDWPLVVIADAVYVTPDAVDSDSTLLHEMAHIVRDFYTCCAGHPALTAVRRQAKQHLEETLTAELQGKIDRFDEILEAFRLKHERSSVRFQHAHDLLFLLMSLKIDLEFGYTPGEVFGYGLQKSSGLIAS